MGAEGLSASATKQDGQTPVPHPAAGTGTLPLAPPTGAGALRETLPVGPRIGTAPGSRAPNAPNAEAGHTGGTCIAGEEVRQAAQARSAGTALARVPGYEVLAELGRGGMGVVYKARDLSLGRAVALKMVLSAEHAGPEELTRFRTEAEALARLQHPNIVQIFEVGEHEGRPYFALEYLEGGSLGAKLDGTPWDARKGAALIESLARAVHAAHQQKVIHRDLKPANVLLTADGAPKITDFGLAKKLDADDGLSKTGQVMGTPSYMPPEQADGRTHLIGPASDVYALGAILYELLTGRPPFKGPTVLDTMQQVLMDEPAAPRRLQSKVPADMETVCLKCLEKEPSRRYGSALELAEELRRFQAGEPLRARRVGALERAAKWARRRPALAAAYGLLLAALVLGVGGGGAVSLWLRAENARGDAENARGRAEAARRRAETAEGDANKARDDLKGALEREKDAKLRLTQYTYADRISLAQREWDAGRVKRARDLLKEAGDLQEDLTPGRRPWEWDYLNRVFHSELAVLEGHTFWVLSAAFSPDGGHITTASQDGTARLWDAKSGKQQAVLQGHTGAVVFVAFSPDGARLATAGADGTARMWDAVSGKPLAVLEGHTGAIASLAFSPDGGRLATTSKDNETRLWDVASRLPVGSLVGHTSPVRSVAFSPDGRRIATGSEDKTARLWDIASGKQIAVLEGHAGSVLCVAFSPDGSRVASASFDQTARLWDAATGKPLTVLKGHTGFVTSVAFSPDGGQVATASLDRLVRLWDAASGRQLAVLQGHTTIVRSVAFSPDGGRLITAGDDGTARLWDAAPANHLAVLEGHASYVRGGAFSPDGRRVAAGGQGGTVRLWETASGRPLTVLTGHAGAIFSVAFGPDGGRIVTASADRTARLWDVESGRQVAALQGHSGDVLWAVFSPDGRRIATASDDKTARLWDAVSGKQLALLEGHAARVWSVAFSPDGARIATGGMDGTARLWDAESGQQLAVLTGHGWVESVAFSPDGGRVATAGFDGMARVWDVPSGRPLLVLEGPGDQVTSVAFSRDGRRIVTASLDGAARVWDADSGRPLVLLEGHGDSLLSAAFSPDDSRIVTTSGDNTARLWIAREGAEDHEKRRRFWREQHAAQAEKGGQWFGAAFHLSRLIDADPTDASLYDRRCGAYAREGQLGNAAADWLHGALLRKPADEPTSP